MSQNYYVLQAPARMENFQPHMHMRGKSMSVEAVYPDGRKEVLSAVNRFQWNWHINYVMPTSVAPLLPKGTVLVFTAWHDNTAKNPNNPDPRQWVGWGDRTVDEMAHAWVDVTYLDQEEFDRLVAERKAHRVRRGSDGQLCSPHLSWTRLRLPCGQPRMKIGRLLATFLIALPPP